MSLRVDHLVTSGTFSLDGQTFDVDNSVWLLGAPGHDDLRRGAVVRGADASGHLT